MLTPAPTEIACAGIQVEFMAEGYAPKLVPMTSTETRVAPGDERRIDVRLVRGAKVVGKVATPTSAPAKPAPAAPAPVAAPAPKPAPAVSAAPVAAVVAATNGMPAS